MASLEAAGNRAGVRRPREGSRSASDAGNGQFGGSADRGDAFRGRQVQNDPMEFGPSLELRLSFLEGQDFLVEFTANGYEFGIIANESEPFCSDCDRLRLDSSGNIYGCLSEEKSEYIADIADDEIKLSEKLLEALKHKQPLKFKGSPLKMISIGG